jgi:pyruvyltransferase
MFKNIIKFKSSKPAITPTIPDYKFNHVEHYYWKPKTGELNFGDHLSRIVVVKILADNGHVLEEETTSQKRLLSLGSILHFANSNDTIWGTGVNGKMPLDHYKFQQLDVRAVRGPLTRNFLLERGISTPEIYGDPAMLLPHIFPGRFERNSCKKYVTVPNLHDLNIAKEKRWQNLISPLNSWNNCIKRILEAELVIASSLHGLIIAETYGLPARYVRLTETENLVKYNDYMMGTGRNKIEFAKSIEEALEMGGMKPPVFDPKKLLNAFPIDLWK